MLAHSHKIHSAHEFDLPDGPDEMLGFTEGGKGLVGIVIVAATFGLLVKHFLRAKNGRLRDDRSVRLQRTMGKCSGPEPPLRSMRSAACRDRFSRVA